MGEESRIVSLPAADRTTPTLADAVFALAGFRSFGADDTGSGPEATFYTQAMSQAGSVSSALKAAKNALEHPCAQDAALVGTARALGMSSAETAAAALAFAIETDALAGRAVAYLQSPVGGARPTLGLLASILAPLEGAEGLIARLANGPAVRSGLLSLGGSGPLPERAVSLADGLIAALSSASVNWPSVEVLAQGPSATWPESLIQSLAPVAEGLVNSPGQMLIVRGASLPDRGEIAARIGHKLGLEPALIDLGRVETHGLGPLCVAARLLPAFVADPPPGEFVSTPALPGYDGPVLVFLGPEGHAGRPGTQPVEWTLPLPTPEERVALWRAIFPEGPLAERLGREHLQSAGRIGELAGSATAAARLAGRSRPDEDTFRAALWVTEGEGLGALAQPVRDSIPDEALVVGPNLRAELAALNARCRHRERLASDLGIAMTARYKVGVRSLFTGPSGTGKTLAAAWLAGRLNLALYRVDLAAVSSKYIGETEKNLSKLLARAEEQEVILLFDEADSLFGKRTDISDSNDRFANAQTNYLLQRIETYTGIVLLTSNAKNRFDEAFTRRIDAIIDFTLPQPTERLALWTAHLGDAHVIAETDLNRLSAMAEIAGGHIRNVVLMAAVLAQEADGPINYAHIAEGLRSEYRKLGWTVPSELLHTGGARR